jgi:type IV secretion system protein TrbF
MFGKKKAADSTVASGTPEGLTATGVYVNMVEGLRQQARDLRRNNTLLLGICLILAVALLLVLPLRKRIPYFYEVDSATGRVALSNRVVEELKVSDLNIAYFLRLWVARVSVINGATLREGLPSAYRWTRGSASTVLDEWVEKTDRTAERIAKTPGLTRELLGSPIVAFNEDRTVAYIDLVWLERNNGVEVKRERKQFTLEFALLPPDPAKSDPDNPLQIAISHFTITDIR